MSVWRKLRRRLRRRSASPDSIPDLMSFDDNSIEEPVDEAPAPMDLLRAERHEKDPGPAHDLANIAESIVRHKARGQVVPQGDLQVLTRLCEDLGSTDEVHLVEQALLAITHTWPELPSPSMLLARLYYRQRRFDAALPLLEILSEQKPTALEAHGLLADFHYRSADARLALLHYEEVLARDFTHPRALPRAKELSNKHVLPGSSTPTLLGGDELGPSHRYELHRELGRGGGGTVYLARDRNLGRPLAVKALHTHITSHAELRSRLFAEARIAASLNHPQVITIYDLDESAGLVAMEYCSGGTLADQMDSELWSPAAALGRLAEMARVLSDVHRAGIVHRDIKPANWLLRGSPAHWQTTPLVLSDFGIAHACDAAQPIGAAGSRAYMAPEQWAGQDADERADIYACGLHLVELLSGHRLPQQPLAGAEIPLLKRLDQESRWEQLGRDVHRSIRAPLFTLIRHILEPIPASRIDSASEVAQRADELSTHCAARAEAEGIGQHIRQQTDASGPGAAPWIERIVDACEPPLRSLHFTSTGHDRPS